MTKIKFRKDIPSKIKEAIRNDQLVVFCGAGMSRLDGCPDWRNLTNGMVQKAASEKVITYMEEACLLAIDDNKRKISSLHALLDKKGKLNVFHEIMKEELNVVNPDTKSSPYSEIFKFGRFILTTNADYRWDDFIEEKNQSYPKDFFPENLDLDKIVFLHGSIKNPDSLVFTYEQYVSRYRDDTYLKFLANVLDNHTVLFLGYSLSEIELLELILPKFSTKEVRNRKLFILEGYFSNESTKLHIDKSYFNRLRIKVWPYSKDEKSYTQQMDILSQLSRETELEHGTGNFNSRLLTRLTRNFTLFNANLLLQMVKVNPSFEDQLWEDLSTTHVSKSKWFPFLVNNSLFDFSRITEDRISEFPNGSRLSISGYPQLGFLWSIFRQNAHTPDPELNKNLDAFVKSYIDFVSDNPLHPAKGFYGYFMDFTCLLNLESIKWEHYERVRAHISEKPNHFRLFYFSEYLFKRILIAGDDELFTRVIVDFCLSESLNPFKADESDFYEMAKQLEFNSQTTAQTLTLSQKFTIINAFFDLLNKSEHGHSFLDWLKPWSVPDPEDISHRTFLINVISFSKRLVLTLPDKDYKKFIKNICHPTTSNSEKRMLLVLLANRPIVSAIDFVFKNLAVLDIFNMKIELIDFFQAILPKASNSNNSRLIAWLKSMQNEDRQQWTSCILRVSPIHNELFTQLSFKELTSFNESEFKSFRNNGFTISASFNSNEFEFPETLRKSMPDQSLKEVIETYKSDWSDLEKPRFSGDGGKRHFLMEFFTNHRSKVIPDFALLKSLAPHIIGLFLLTTSKNKSENDLTVSDYLTLFERVFSSDSKLEYQDFRLLSYALRDFLSSNSFVDSPSDKFSSSEVSRVYNLVASSLHRLDAHPPQWPDKISMSLVNDPVEILLSTLISQSVKTKSASKSKSENLHPIIDDCLDWGLSDPLRWQYQAFCGFHLNQLHYLSPSFVREKLLHLIDVPSGSDYILKMFVQRGGTYYKDTVGLMADHLVTSCIHWTSDDEEFKSLGQRMSLFLSRMPEVGLPMLQTIFSVNNQKLLDILTENLAQSEISVTDQERLSIVGYFDDYLSANSVNLPHIVRLRSNLTKYLIKSDFFVSATIEKCCSLMVGIKSFPRGFFYQLIQKAPKFPLECLDILQCWASEVDPDTLKIDHATDNHYVREIFDNLMKMGYGRRLRQIHEILISRGISNFREIIY